MLGKSAIYHIAAQARELRGRQSVESGRDRQLADPAFIEEYVNGGESGFISIGRLAPSSWI
jgi:hypothetical protein